MKETDPGPRVTFLYPQCILSFLKQGLFARKRGEGGEESSADFIVPLWKEKKINR